MLQIVDAWTVEIYHSQEWLMSLNNAPPKTIGYLLTQKQVAFQLLAHPQMSRQES